MGYVAGPHGVCRGYRSPPFAMTKPVSAVRPLLLALLVAAPAALPAGAQDVTVATFNCEWLVLRHVDRKPWPDADTAPWGDPAFRAARFREAAGRDAADVGERWTYTFEGERQQIDLVLVSYGVKDATRRARGIEARTLDPGNPLASDHRALPVTLHFTE